MPAETNDANTGRLLRMFSPTHKLFSPARVSRSRRQPSSRVRRRPGKDAVHTFRPRTDKKEARNRGDRCRLFARGSAQSHLWKSVFEKTHKLPPGYTSSTT